MDRDSLAAELHAVYIEALSSGQSVNKVWDTMATCVLLLMEKSPAPS